MILETPKMLVLSTAHISESTKNMLLHGYGEYPAGVATRDTGFIIPIYDGWPEWTPDDLVTIRHFAHLNGCTWICLDQDAGKIQGLPEYDW